MTDDPKIGFDLAPSGHSVPSGRLPYEPPRVETCGTIHAVVLGASLGTGESANPTLFFAGITGNRPAPPPLNRGSQP